MNLVVDVGNTSAKVAIFDHHHLVENQSFSSVDSLKPFLKKKHFENGIISSVHTDAEEIAGWIQADQKFILTHLLPLPIKIQYTTPHTLGVDRIAGACGAFQLFPGMNTLVIDAGTCVTYDFTDSNGNYYGGGISPGMMMRFEALHTFTAKLPLIKPEKMVELIGDSTETSIRSGVINGMAAEMDGIIGQYSIKYPQMQVILCGGDAAFFENRLKASIFASPYLVLLGLNSVLIHNVRK